MPRLPLLLALLLTAATLASPTTQPAAPPATQPASPATITGIEGPLVQFRQKDDEPWQRARVGIELRDTAALRVGPRSAVRVTFPSGEPVTLDRLGSTSLKELRESPRVTNDLGLLHGRTRYDVKAAGLEHSGTIRSPSATLSIRSGPLSNPWAPTTQPAALRDARLCPCHVLIPRTEAPATQPGD